MAVLLALTTREQRFHLRRLMWILVGLLALTLLALNAVVIAWNLQDILTCREDIKCFGPCLPTIGQCCAVLAVVSLCACVTAVSCCVAVVSLCPCVTAELAVVLCPCVPTIGQCRAVLAVVSLCPCVTAELAVVLCPCVPSAALCELLCHTPTPMRCDWNSV
jgi:hypothetical protein